MRPPFASCTLGTWTSPGSSFRALAVGMLMAIGCRESRDAQATPLPTATPTDRFWAIVEHARARSSECDNVAQRLADTLSRLPAPAIVEFSNELDARMAESYRWDLWAVAYVANGGASDDGFDYFRAWLITRGREQFERALRDAPSAVEGAPRSGELECEDVIGVANEAYNRVAGKAMPASTVRWPKEPVGKPWTEETIDQVYPGLTARVRKR